MSRFFTWFPSRCPQNTNCRQKLTSRERPGRCPFNHVTKVNVASEGTNQKHASPEGLCYSRLRCVICKLICGWWRDIVPPAWPHS